MSSGASGSKRREPQRARRSSSTGAPGVGRLEDLDDHLLLMIMERSEFPARPALAQASRRFRRLADNEFWVHEVDGERLSLIDAVERARPGDTLRLTGPFFQEAFIADKPLRIVGAAAAPGCAGGRATLFQARPPVVLAQARVLFQNVVLHTGAQRDDTSIAVFGPDCPYLRFEGCRLLGATGLALPASKPRGTRVELHDCELANVTSGCAALQVATGLLVMRRCLVRNSSIGIEIGREAFADLSGVQLQSNSVACHLDGSVSIRDCAIWANSAVGCAPTEARLQQAMARAARRAQPQPAPPGEPPATPAAALAAPGAGAAPGSAERVNPWSALSPSIAAWRSAGGVGAGAGAGLGPTGAGAGALAPSPAPAGARALAPAAADGMAPPRARRVPRKQQQLAAEATAARPATPPPPAGGAAVGAPGGGGGGEGVSPELWAAFQEAARGRGSGGGAAVMEVSNLLVVPPEVSYKSKEQKDVRKRMKALNEQVHGPSDNLFRGWEVLGHSDLDTEDEDDDDLELDSSELLEQEGSDAEMDADMDSSGGDDDDDEEEEEEEEEEDDDDEGGGSSGAGGDDDSDGVGGGPAGSGSEGGAGGGGAAGSSSDDEDYDSGDASSGHSGSMSTGSGGGGSGGTTSSSEDEEESG